MSGEGLAVAEQARPKQPPAERDPKAARDFLAAQVGRFTGLRDQMEALMRRDGQIGSPGDRDRWWDDMKRLGQDIEAMQSRGLARKVFSMVDPSYDLGGGGKHKKAQAGTD